MENKMSKELESLLKSIAENNNVSWENALFFFNMGFHEGKIKTLLGEMK